MNNWKRFLDNCDILLETEKVTLEVALEILNFIHPSVQFTMEVSENCLPFLDILIKKMTRYG